MKASIVDRLSDKFLVGNGCWEWIGAKIPGGYGHFHLDGKPVGAHRVLYELMVGPIPEGLVIDHLCCNRRCVNPGHMEVVTTQENTRRGGLSKVSEMRAKKRTHCPHGHPYSGENLFITNRGHRECRICMRASRRRSKERLKNK